MSRRSREEILADISAHEQNIAGSKTQLNALHVELAKYKTEDREEANKRLTAIGDQINVLLEQAGKLCNEFKLEFTVQNDEGDFYYEFDTYAYGNWAHSSC